MNDLSRHVRQMARAVGALCVMACTTVGAQDIANSVVTVEELLRIDNAQALEKARADAMKTGLLTPPKPPAGTKPSLATPKWTVRAIFGQGSDLAADVVVDSTSFQSAKAGATLGVCRIKSIEAKCVKLANLNTKTPAGSCPATVCWTGAELALELQPPQTQTTAAGRVMPGPLPGTPPIPVVTGRDAPATLPREPAKR